MADFFPSSFHGVIRVTPKGMIVPAFELEADWLYDPDKKVYIANGVEYSEKICEIVMFTKKGS